MPTNIVVLLLWLCAASLVYSGRPKDFVKELTSSIFDSEVLADSDYLVEFYSPMCGHCKKFAPDYSKVSIHLHGVVKAGRISVSSDGVMPIMKKYNVEVVPTVFLFTTEEEDPILYEETTRAPTSIVKWVLKSLAKKIVPLRSVDALNDFLFVKTEHNNNIARFPFFPTRYLLVHNGSVPEIYTTIATKENGKFVFGAVQLVNDGFAHEVAQIPVFREIPSWESNTLVRVKSVQGENEFLYVASYGIHQRKSIRELFSLVGDESEPITSRDTILKPPEATQPIIENTIPTPKPEEVKPIPHVTVDTRPNITMKAVFLSIFGFVSCVMFALFLQAKRPRKAELVELKKIDWEISDDDDESDDKFD